ncbi:TAXI family TRAP transporter solute-binding subunit [Alicyclobacillus sp. SO9]|uniref:TAXI family TRAP transporter solute-binding subunit n=1 Tax=Alicyclobacillus sp. SO9 TaxID=2665646 RepID=UPI0018E84914|nr:TAXI family TRAP transporter solute-binding subunit [Alicyclobacillus sp. SO9]QQE77610.1 TAXI family TRAP transporter solute-binding subunit [Alicyclobacillus sp. SO9]
MKIKYFAVPMATIALGVSLAGCGQSNNTTTNGGGHSNGTGSGTATYKVNIGTATTTGVFYPFGAELAKIWSQKLSHVHAASQVTNGSVENLNLLEQGKINVAFTTIGVLHEAYTGTGAFKGKPYKDVRVLAGLYPSVAQMIVRKGLNIKSVSDLKGKSFVPGAPGSSTKVLAQSILKAYGLKLTDVKPQFVGFTSAVNLMKNHQADGAFITAGIPTSAVTQMLTTANGQLLSLGSGQISSLQKNYPWLYPYTIKAGAYDKQTSPVHTVAQNIMLVVPASMPKQEAYELTKALWQNIGPIGQTVSAAKNSKLANATKGLAGVPLAAGAKEYYQQKGM